MGMHMDVVEVVKGEVRMVVTPALVASGVCETFRMLVV